MINEETKDPVKIILEYYLFTYCYWDSAIFYHGKENEDKSKVQLKQFHEDFAEVNKFDSSSEDYKKAYWKNVAKWVSNEKVEDFRKYMKTEQKKLGNKNENT